MARHKWERHGHYLHHEKICIKCGCIKNTRTLQTEYHFKGKVYEHAPPCPETQEHYLLKEIDRYNLEKINKYIDMNVCISKHSKGEYCKYDDVLLLKEELREIVQLSKKMISYPIKHGDNCTWNDETIKHEDKLCSCGMLETFEDIRDFKYVIKGG